MMMMTQLDQLVMEEVDLMVVAAVMAWEKGGEANLIPTPLLAGAGALRLGRSHGRRASS